MCGGGGGRGYGPRNGQECYGGGGGSGIVKFPYRYIQKDFMDLVFLISVWKYLYIDLIK